MIDLSGKRALVFGVAQARRGSAEPAHVANTLAASGLEKDLGHARTR